MYKIIDHVIPLLRILSWFLNSIRKHSNLFTVAFKSPHDPAPISLPLLASYLNLLSKFVTSFSPIYGLLFPEHAWLTLRVSACRFTSGWLFPVSEVTASSSMSSLTAAPRHYHVILLNSPQSTSVYTK